MSTNQMSHIALKKLVSDLKDANSGDYNELFKLEPVMRKTLTVEGTIEEEPNLFHWSAELNGPKDTPYETGKFILNIVIPETYPNKPPLITFVTKVFHPNIDKTGQICLNILRSPPNGDWKPSLNLPKTVLSIHSLLSDPNPKDPLNAEAARMYAEDHDHWLATAKQWTFLYAKYN